MTSDHLKLLFALSSAGKGDARRYGVHAAAAQIILSHQRCCAGQGIASDRIAEEIRIGIGELLVKQVDDSTPRSIWKLLHEAFGEQAWRKNIRAEMCRSEERRVGKECVSTFRSRWS